MPTKPNDAVATQVMPSSGASFGDLPHAESEHGMFGMATALVVEK